MINMILSNSWSSVARRHMPILTEMPPCLVRSSRITPQPRSFAHHEAIVRGLKPSGHNTNMMLLISIRAIRGSLRSSTWRRAMSWPTGSGSNVPRFICMVGLNQPPSTCVSPNCSVVRGKAGNSFTGMLTRYSPNPKQCPNNIGPPTPHEPFRT
jgi:hypothetical protein